MNKSDIVKQAENGDINAINTLLNQALNPQNITAKSKLNNTTLQIILESPQNINEQVALNSITRAIGKLNIQNNLIQNFKIYARKQGKKTFLWEKEIDYSPIQQTIIQPPEQNITPVTIHRNIFEQASKETIMLGVYIGGGLIISSIIIVMGLFINQSQNTNKSTSSPVTNNPPVTQPNNPNNSSPNPAPSSESSPTPTVTPSETPNNSNSENTVIDISGKWTGKLKLINDNTNLSLHTYTVIINQKNNNFTGLARMELEAPPQHYAVTNMIGTISDNKVNLTEVKLIESSSTKWCLLENGKLEYANKNGQEILAGTGTDCNGLWAIYLEKTNP